MAAQSRDVHGACNARTAAKSRLVGIHSPCELQGVCNGCKVEARFSSVAGGMMLGCLDPEVLDRIQVLEWDAVDGGDGLVDGG